MDEYIVVLNDEDCYSCWRAELNPPLGWRPAGFSGTKDACLDWIERVWVDQRPRSLRDRMANSNDKVLVPAEYCDQLIESPDLIETLCDRAHAVRCELFGDRLAERVAAGVIHLYLPETQGGTTLGVRINESEFIGGELCLDGSLTLDFVELRCKARIDTQMLSGNVWMERASASHKKVAANDA